MADAAKAPLLRVDDLTVNYGQISALRGISIEVHAGESVALLGANGAGKSTLIRSVVGALPATGGDIALDGHSLAGVPAHRRAQLGMGYSPEGRRVFAALSVRDNLEVASRDTRAGTQAMVERVFGMFPALAEKQHLASWTLSGGQQQMLAIGRALMGRPRLLLLDEPSLGLSPKLMREVLDQIPVIAATGTSIVLAEQNASVALRLVSRAYVIQNGRVVAEGPAATLRDDPAIRAAFFGETLH